MTFMGIIVNVKLCDSVFPLSNGVNTGPPKTAK